MLDQSLGLVGLSYKTAPVKIRESFAPLPEQRLKFFAEARTSLDGFAILSTCNRIEFYGHRYGSGHASRALESLLHDRFNLELAEPYLYCKQSHDVSRHLMRVACGLDSMVLGESQILGQVSDCLLSSETASCVSPELSTVFRAAIQAGRRAHGETALGRFPVSIASVAIEHILLEAGSLHNLHVAVIGTGEMGRLVGKILQKKEIAQLTFVNRSYAHAKKMAVDACAQAVPMEELREAVSRADVVISATEAPHIILGPEHIAYRANRPLFLVDLAVPRDIDPFLNELPGVRLLDIDHLKHDVAQSKAAREAEVPEVEKIIENELSILDRRLQMLSMEPVIAALRQKAETIRRAELSRTLEVLGPVEDQIVERMEYFSNALVKKLLHEPTLHLRHGNTELPPQTVRNLFGLPEPSADK